jgi:hypothetical protein
MGGRNDDTSPANISSRIHPGAQRNDGGKRKVPSIATDIERYGSHYAKTLRQWYAAGAEAVPHYLTKRFYRMWTFYLVAGDGGTRKRQILSDPIQPQPPCPTAGSGLFGGKWAGFARE